MAFRGVEQTSKLVGSVTKGIPYVAQVAKMRAFGKRSSGLCNVTPRPEKMFKPLLGVLVIVSW